MLKASAGPQPEPLFHDKQIELIREVLLAAVDDEKRKTALQAFDEIEQRFRQTQVALSEIVRSQVTTLDKALELALGVSVSIDISAERLNDGRDRVRFHFAKDYCNDGRSIISMHDSKPADAAKLGSPRKSS